MHMARNCNSQKDKIISLNNRCSDLATENQNLEDRYNEALGHTNRMQEINNQIENLQNQIREETNKNIESNNEAAYQNMEFEKVERIALLNNQIKELNDEFLRIRCSNIRNDLRLAEYERNCRLQLETINILNTFTSELVEIMRTGDNDDQKTRIKALRNQIGERFEQYRASIDANNQTMATEINEINKRLSQLTNMEIN